CFDGAIRFSRGPGPSHRRRTHHSRDTGGRQWPAYGENHSREDERGRKSSDHPHRRWLDYDSKVVVRHSSAPAAKLTSLELPSSERLCFQRLPVPAQKRIHVQKHCDFFHPDHPFLWCYCPKCCFPATSPERDIHGQNYRSLRGFLSVCLRWLDEEQPDTSRSVELGCVFQSRRR